MTSNNFAQNKRGWCKYAPLV